MNKHRHPAHIPRKRFGQHFLCDPGVIQRIVSVIDPQKTDHIVEIGPGLGALTTQIFPLVHKLNVVELDRDIIPHLNQLCRTTTNLTIHQADALSFNFAALTALPRSLRIIGNLPYNISTPLLFHLLDQLKIIKDMHFMLQKEVVDRLAAQPGDPMYGRLSIMVQYHCQVVALFVVTPDAFDPPPQVRSAVARLLPYPEPPFNANDFLIFTQVVRQAFSQRRKILRNCLKGLVSEQQLTALDIDVYQRPEELSVSDYVRISNHITEAG